MRTMENRGLKLRSRDHRSRPVELSELTIGVLYGGLSSERDVSLVSGEQVLSALVREGLCVVPIEVNESFSVESLLFRGVDVVFLALHGGDGENGVMQSQLDKIGIPYHGSGAYASRIAMDKPWSKRLFQARGIPTPAFSVASSVDAIGDIDSIGGFPLVVKPARGGSSIGVRIVNAKDELTDAVTAIVDPADGTSKDDALIERAIRGTEITVGILGDRALPPVELVIKNSFFDFDAKYSDNAGTEYRCPAKLPGQANFAAMKLALDIHRAIGCRDVSRTDMIIDAEERLWVLETNTLPGMTPHSLLPKAASTVGISYPQLCKRLVGMAVSREIAGGSKRLRAAG